MNLRAIADKELSFHTKVIAKSPLTSPKSKKSPNIIKRNKSIQYHQIPKGKRISSFGTSSTERNEIVESALPGPGEYTVNKSAFNFSPKSPKSKTTFGLSSKETAKEVSKSNKLGPGMYDILSPSKRTVKGGSWTKATRHVSATVNIKLTMSPGPGEYNPIQTEKPIFTNAGTELETAQFDWKLYRKQYHDILLKKDPSAKSANSKSVKSPSHIATKFRALSMSPTHNKSGSNHFGTSPRFNDKNTNPMALSSFKTAVGNSVGEILA